MPIAAGVPRGSSSGVRRSSGALTTACPPPPPAAPPARRCAPTPRTAPAAVTHGSSAGTNADARTGSGRSVHLSQFPFFIYPSVTVRGREPMHWPRYIRLPSCARCIVFPKIIDLVLLTLLARPLACLLSALQKPLISFLPSVYQKN